MWHRAMFMPRGHQLTHVRCYVTAMSVTITPHRLTRSTWSHMANDMASTSSIKPFMQRHVAPGAMLLRHVYVARVCLLFEVAHSLDMFDELEVATRLGDAAL